ncbi:bifunctional demethylmenaquinone methyltransferase/2-methoxy-6-polyprenyl-1,4-benzoquinol methylase UbiE [Chryseobacterium echinoideorum]|uniref:bifunctional demethylmenaquinone methyltransferase/2-methoxy-6-polyprenyl-1,4-benzoquinol methylase UbiE n=1 Tax=Chryseobacterium echinoideorum TaxID=1549648 RepID=UPI001186CABE|nr:bifunctional demethylmenaquinone methyltransferase/2-methoxy-6-polyprenyl-1,4-benzoquinol methylase UbiE [Chryseobacterium echinoideorum]
MNKQVIVPYKTSNKGKSAQVEKMFNDISKNYDFLNRLITFGMDRKWRNNVLELVKKSNPENIIDVATGTGDMAILFSKTNAKSIVSVDISKGMLEVANKKIMKENLQKRITTELSNAENLSFKDSTFDVASVIYGIRNFENLSNGLSEIHRVLNKNGIIVILETSQPTNRFLRAFYLLYTRILMPCIAKIVSKDKYAYQYLSKSAINFPYGSELKTIIQNAGFKSVSLYPQFFGASTIYYAEK